MHYYLAPYDWRDIGGMMGYAAPAGVVGSVDLRTLGQQGGAGGGGVGFFAAPSPLAGLTAIASGDLREINSTGAMRSAWKSLTGVTVQGDKLIDLLWDNLTEGADPNGDAACCPLMPSRSLDLELHLGWHSLIKTAKLDKASRHWNKVQAVERRNVESLYKAAQRGEVSEDLIRTNHDHLGRKYGIDKPEDFFTPAGREKLARKLAHTTKTESWPTNGAITSGQDQTWSNITSSLTVASGQVRGTTAIAANVARMEYDFATDHYGQLVWKSTSGVNDGHGPLIRKDSSATITFYAALYGDNGTRWESAKLVAGAYTIIGTNTTGLAAVANDVFRLDASGSSIARIRNGTTQNTATDTAISSGGRTGIRTFGSLQFSDSFEGGDATSTYVPYITGRMSGGLQQLTGGLV